MLYINKVYITTKYTLNEIAGRFRENIPFNVTDTNLKNKIKRQ
jgi:hypothetical protein